MSGPQLSVVVIAYNMGREIPRTVRSLSPAVCGMERTEYEIVLVDNGSTEPLDADALRRWGADLVLHRVERARPSPVQAINVGVRLARGGLIGVMVDGARIASPGLLRNALLAWNLHRRPVIASLAFHLGPAVQRESVLRGYDRAAEDRLLAKVDWPTDGYRLFDVSAFAGSSGGGWFQAIAESNALFLPKELWDELGGYDERFESPGGGLANLDTYQRACALPGSQLIVLLGEGTFHQIHGGVATNAPVHPWDRFHEEYVRIRGHPFQAPEPPCWYFGQVRPQVLTSIEWSARRARERRHPR